MRRTLPERGAKRPYETLHLVLVNAQHERDKRQGMVGKPPNEEPGWALYERLVLWGEVNRLRQEQGKPEVEIDLIEAAERQAAGHSDYTTKFALGAEDVVLR